MGDGDLNIARFDLKVDNDVTDFLSTPAFDSNALFPTGTYDTIFSNAIILSGNNGKTRISMIITGQAKV